MAPHVREPPELLHVGQQQVVAFVLGVSTCGDDTCCHCRVRRAEGNPGTGQGAAQTEIGNGYGVLAWGASCKGCSRGSRKAPGLGWCRAAPLPSFLDWDFWIHKLSASSPVWKNFPEYPKLKVKLGMWVRSSFCVSNSACEGGERAQQPQPGAAGHSLTTKPAAKRGKNLHP